MPRCDCDAVMCRMFSTILLSIAFISTIVLVYLIIDIHGALNKEKEPKLIVHTVLNVMPVKVNKLQTEKRFKEIMEVIYKAANTDNNNQVISGKVLVLKPKVDAKNKTMYIINTYQSITKAAMNKIFDRYYYKKRDGKSKENIKQRMKRRVKIRYEFNDKTTIKPKTNESSTKDHEILVEIETHFNNKRLKSEQKEKLIKEINNKIQKVIHNEIIQNEDKKKKQKHLHIRKRIQNPLNHMHKTVFIQKLAFPFQGVYRRRIEPISKSLSSYGPLPNTDNKSGENWRIESTKLNLLSPSKVINSAELALVNTDYDKVLESNEISQRLQKPLNTDSSDEILHTYYDLGNLKFSGKDIAGNEFSVGFHQYQEAAPDIETMKFTGLENILQNYHQDYDLSNQPTTENFENIIHDIELSNTDHNIAKRSIDKDYHFNEHKFIFNANYMPYSNYKEVVGKKTSKNQVPKGKQILVADENIIDKNLKPAEIFSLAELFLTKRSSKKTHTNFLKYKRFKPILRRFHLKKKRLFKVKKVSNLKSKIRFNRILNSKPTTEKQIIMTKKRNKREISKIRIITRDYGRNSRHSEEDIFVSDENIFSERNAVRGINNIGPAASNFQPMVQQQTESNKEMNYDYNIIPYWHESYNNVYSKSIRNNELMSKYPHILLENIGRSKEYELPYNMVNSIDSSTKDYIKTPLKLDQVTVDALSSNEMSGKVNDIVNAIAPKSNYKLTFKITPKNTTNINSGYKETHTIMNNSFNRDGLQYLSLVNISEISKVIKLNKTKESNEIEVISQPPLLKEIIETRNKIKRLLQQYKERNAKLQTLNQGKEKLDSLIVNNETENAYPSLNLDYDIPSQVNATNKIKVPIEKSNNINQTETIQKSTEAQQTMTEMDKIRLVNSIERNKNQTTEILKKIDRNTDLLEKLFQKVMSTIEFTKGDTKPTKVDLNQLNTESQTDAIFKHDMSNINDINAAELFSKTLPNAETLYNNTM